jgi:hypothetical protein
MPSQRDDENQQRTGGSPESSSNPEPEREVKPRTLPMLQTRIFKNTHKAMKSIRKRTGSPIVAAKP